ncbi:MAG: FAD-dependent oxidoreductase [Spirochaetia bacterium]|nr:FAD-dependent oxidoreductase [Spirochaetia bacterium]
MSEFVREIKADGFESHVLGQGSAILDFYSTDCPPCEALAPKFESLAELFHPYVRFVKIYRQESRELAAKLGVTSSPTLIFFKDGKEVFRRLTGGILKRDITAGLSNLLGREKTEEILATKPKRTIQCDVAILGGGPAGLSAALYAAQAKLDTYVVDSAVPGGQVKNTHQVSNYPGTEKPVSGYELAHRMLRQAEDAGAHFIAAVDVTNVHLSAGANEIMIDDDTVLHAKSVILATGAEPRPLGVPGEADYKGRGIHYCATCDGKYYEGKEVVVIGGGNSAVEESLFLAKFADKVTIVHQFDTLQANKTAQARAFAEPKINFVFSHEPRRFERTGDRMIITLEDMKTHEQRTLETDGVFVFVGMVPNLGHIEGDLKKNQWGYLETDEDMQTNIPGVFGAGDVRSKKIRQAATAVSDGCIAAVMAERWIEAERPVGEKAHV